MDDVPRKQFEERKTEYISAISNQLLQCQDISLLDLILKLLYKSEKIDL